MKNTGTLEVSGNSFAAIYRFVDNAILVFVLLVACFLYGNQFDQDYLLLLLAHVVTFSYFAEGLELYRPWRTNKFSRMLAQVMLILCMSFFLLVAVFFIFKAGADYSRVIIGGWFAGSATLMVTWRAVLRFVQRYRYAHGINVQNAAILGLTQRGIDTAEQLLKQREYGLHFVGFYDDRAPERLEEKWLQHLHGTVEQAVEAAKQGQFSRLYICLPLHATQRIAQVVEQLGDTTLDVFLVPDLFLLSMMQGRLSSIGDVDTISVFESPQLGVQNYVKRTFDIAFSLSVLLLLSPLYIAIGLAIKLTSRGPVFFIQDRYGLDGKKIGVYKFRSMKVMENSADVVQATKDDPRVTALGRFLRRTSLDELPQFLNVLKGDMSVVGPRPHAVSHNEFYRQQVSFYMLRHKVRPGITGWAQVNGWRGETDTLDKMAKRVEYDLYYIRNWSLWWDVKIIFKTIFNGFGGKNAY